MTEADQALSDATAADDLFRPICTVDHASRLINESAEDLKQTLRREYFREQLNGGDDWPDMLTIEAKDTALTEIACAIRELREIDRESVLLKVQLILSNLIAEAARAQAETCERNKTL